MGRCTSPLKGWQPLSGGALKFGQRPPLSQPITVRCGQCMDCRLEKSRQWAVRCVHEAQLHEHNSFITLTYDDASIPDTGTLNKPDLQRFFKRLRHECGPFRYYACGEYGDTTQRAHYHACIFGLDFHDKIEYRRIGDNKLYLSETLTRIWGHGNTSVGSLTFESAAYCARYVTKKTNGALARYVHLDTETGEIQPLVQPFAVMSNGGGRRTDDSPRMGGIGKPWFQKHHSDIYGADKDFVFVRGIKMRPTAYYDKLYDLIEPLRLKRLKRNRKLLTTPESDAQLRARAQNTRARLFARKQV